MKKGIKITRPKSDFPELVVDVPDSWPYIILEPLYDVHLLHNLHASVQFLQDVQRIAKAPYTLTFNGGDLIENSVLGSPGIWDQKAPPNEQFKMAHEIIEPIVDKMLFAIPGNHEARTAKVAGLDIAKLLADKLGVQYFPDYCFLLIRWRDNKVRGIIHHGSGGAQTPGGQRNAARKDTPWARADFHWTGHLHQKLVDLLYQLDHSQRTGRTVRRDALVMISPSYLNFFGSYAAGKRYTPGSTGTTTMTIYPNGDLMSPVIAKGRRL